MHKQWLAVGMISLSLLACGRTPPEAQAPTPSGEASSQLIPQKMNAPRSERYVVVFRDEAVPADVAGRVSRAGGRLNRSLPGLGVVTVSGDAAFRQRVAADRAVLAVGPEAHHSLPATEGVTAANVVTDDLSGEQWDMRRIGAEAGARRAGARQAGVLVAVLDTGVMDDHPDLRGQVVLNVGTNYCRETGGPEGTSGYPVYRMALDLTAPSSPSAASCTTTGAITYEGHGTHVAGILAARADGEGITGVAPGVRLASYKVFDRYRTVDGQGQPGEELGAFDSPIFAAILDAVGRGAAVINLSLTSTLDRANRDQNASWLAWNRMANYATRRGALLVASAGNGAGRSGGTVARVPADLPNVVSVAASGTTRLDLDGQGNLLPNGGDVLAYYSNWGPRTDLAAPGGDCGTNPANRLSWCDGPSGNMNELPDDYYRYMILSTMIHGDGSAGYVHLSGTSMAAPHVAGVAALVKALHPGWGPHRLRAHLRATAEKMGQKQAFGGGLVNADHATR